MYFYHAKFGKQAKYCEEGCLGWKTRVPGCYFGSTSQPPVYIADSASNCRYLADLGSVFYIMPWKSQTAPSIPMLSSTDGWGERPFTVTINDVPYFGSGISYWPWSVSRFLGWTFCNITDCLWKWPTSSYCPKRCQWPLLFPPQTRQTRLRVSAPTPRCEGDLFTFRQILYIFSE
jgi:hypothetical protein